MNKSRIVLCVFTLLLITLFGPVSVFAQDFDSNDPQTTEDAEVIDQIIEEDLNEENFEDLFSDENLEEEFDELYNERLEDDSAKEYYYEYFDDQSGNVEGEFAEILAGFGFFFIVFAFWIFAALFIAIPFYIYYALAAYTIGQKLGVENGWMAWVPIFNLYYYVKLSGLEVWWFFLLFVPFVNIFAQIYVWMKIAGRRGFEEWLGLLMLVPFVNFFVPGYLAWGSPPNNKSTD